MERSSSGRNGGEKNEEASVVGGLDFGHGVSSAAGNGAGGGEEATTEAGAESVAGGAGTVERNRAEVDHHRGGFAGG